MHDNKGYDNGEHREYREAAHGGNVFAINLSHVHLNASLMQTSIKK
jgi:hypothetical protein